MSEDENPVTETESMEPTQTESESTLIGEGEPSPSVESPLVQQSAPVERYPVDSDLWGPVNAVFCEMCKRAGLPKGHQDVVFDRKMGSFLVLSRPSE